MKHEVRAKEKEERMGGVVTWNYDKNERRGRLRRHGSQRKSLSGRASDENTRMKWSGSGWERCHVHNIGDTAKARDSFVESFCKEKEWHERGTGRDKGGANECIVSSLIMFISHFSSSFLSRISTLFMHQRELILSLSLLSLPHSP